MDILTLDPYVLHGLEHHVCLLSGNLHKGVLVIHIDASHHFARHSRLACNGSQDIAWLYVLVLSNVDEKSGHIVSSGSASSAAGASASSSAGISVPVISQVI